MTGQKTKIQIFESDLPDAMLQHYLGQKIIAVDTETRGLVIPRDRLCLVQICDSNETVSFVRYTGKPAPNLVKLFSNKSTVKLFHYARFDVAVLLHYLQVETGPIWCTKIASKLVRTYTDKHSLKYLVQELLGRELDKSDQMSDWAKEDLTDSQLNYAANDVRVLIPMKEKLEAMLKREGRDEIAKQLFAFLPTVAQMDLLGFRDIFEH